MFGTLKKSWCGLQDASRTWHGDYSELLTSNGGSIGASSAIIFFKADEGCRCHRSSRSLRHFGLVPVAEIEMCIQGVFDHLCTKKEDDISSTVFSDSERERETRTVSASKHQTLDTHSFVSENSDWDKLQMQRLLSFTRASICGYTRLLVITSTFVFAFDFFPFRVFSRCY